MRKITYAEAISEATVQLMSEDKKVFVIGLGVDDPKGVFNTTLEAHKKFPKRVIGMPIAENGMTGIALGAAATGMKPIMTHQRIDFMMMCMDQLVNHLAKYSFLTGNKSFAPVTIRAIIGRGWGQASQHSQSLQALFAHIPGLQVVMPYRPCDVKGVLASSVKGKNPTIILEHRWLHREEGSVPKELYENITGKANIIKKGKDITIIGISRMNMEIKKAVSELEAFNIDAEWIDLNWIKPWDKKTILKSVKKTGKLIIAEIGHKSFGVGGEIISSIIEEDSKIFKKPPKRICWPDIPVPCGKLIESEYYPDYSDIINSVLDVLDININKCKKRTSNGEKKFEGAF